jgi:AcrR family transcriptional regulator
MMKGRPRSKSSRRAVLDATLGLVEECRGSKGVTMEAIAKRAGVGKQTVYRWWGGPGDIFLEILSESARMEIDEIPDNHDLKSFLTYTFQALKPTVRLILKSLIAEAIKDDALRERFVAGFILSHRLALQKVLNHSQGLLIKDQTVLTDFIVGLIWYRLLLGIGSLEVDEGEKIAALLCGKS